MEKIDCPYCGEVYPADADKCPLCGAQNKKKLISKDNVCESVECPACGEVYPADYKKCTMCGMVNPKYEEAVANSVAEDYTEPEPDYSKATIIDEECDYVPEKKREYEKQKTPDKNIVLISFIGIIVIIILGFASCASHIAGNASSKIGADIFDTRQETER